MLECKYLRPCTAEVVPEAPDGYSIECETMPCDGRRPRDPVGDPARVQASPGRPAGRESDGDGLGAPLPRTHKTVFIYRQLVSHAPSGSSSRRSYMMSVRNTYLTPDCRGGTSCMI